jgi:GDPmannose 4,6-dehydratase
MQSTNRHSRNTKKKALIFGVTGQDGSYLAELLLDKNYDVHGVIRQTSAGTNGNGFVNIEQIRKRITLHVGDLGDDTSIRHVLFKTCPDEVYNLAAQSDVHLSFNMPVYTANITGLGAIRILESIRDFQHETNRKIRMYQAGSSEIFGVAPAPQNENTPFRPRSPYGCAKAFAHTVAGNYRAAYGLFVSCGISYNHESPRRSERFVTRKITKGIHQILAGKEKKIILGNIDSKRDWGYAPEYVEAMWRMLQQDTPDDFIIGTGVTHSVKDFLIYAFQHAGIENWEHYIEIDPALYRPSEAILLIANPQKAERILGWKPAVTCNEIARIMVNSDMAINQNS